MKVFNIAILEEKTAKANSKYNPQSCIHIRLKAGAFHAYFVKGQSNTSKRNNQSPCNDCQSNNLMFYALVTTNQVLI